MLFSVSTVKDSVAGVDEFVARNLANGVDHLLVFVDDGSPEVLAAFADHPHVTAVDAGPSWWQGDRPELLNVRQRVNANLARTLLAPFDWAEWLFHIDGDECLDVDRTALAALPPEADVVRATPLEAVSRAEWPTGRVTHFKRLLEPDELVLLQVLGVIDEPRNGHYFHGNLQGKPGMRPGMQRWLALHDVLDADDREVPPVDGTADIARVLHYESWSAEEFARKWHNLLRSGNQVSLRPLREPTAVALRTLLDRDLPETTLQPYVRRIFERTTADDLETLRDLGLLEELDPESGTHRPEELGSDRWADLEALLAAVTPERKRAFQTGATAGKARSALGRALKRVPDAELRSRARDAWTAGASRLKGGRRSPGRR